MTTTPLNPYGTSTTILEAERFFGRTEALDYLYSEIIARRCVSVVGTRRIGKSSLLRCIVLPEIQQRFASVYDLQKHLLVYIDLGEFLTDTVQDFLDEVCTQLLAQSRPGLVLQAPQEEDSPDKLRSLLDQIQEQGFHTVLLFDAFHKITYNTHFDASFFSFLRAQANHGRVSYITASITPLDTCCHPYIEGSPFFNIFGVYHLGTLDNHEAHQLITEPARACGDPFSEQDVEEILTLAGRHPFFIQRVACLLFREKNQRHQ
ncbi:MAG: ATP-binding protein, partial [Ktedonobacteraceae bacterium]|nr:ATP-binding protein [Ktedonobacteraceae bacterium]